MPHKITINTATKIFQNKLGYVPSIFSYPFGEYSLYMKNYISKQFKVAFGQHSGIIDINKDKFELPRFPINEKYGEIKRFKSLTKTLPFKFKKISPDEKYLLQVKNPPNVKIEFYNDIENLKSVKVVDEHGEKVEVCTVRNGKIELDDGVGQGEYVNLAIVTHSPAEVVMDFIRILPGMTKSKVKSVVRYIYFEKDIYELDKKNYLL